MKLGTLVNNREVLDRICKARIDGKRALKLRKGLKRLREELQTYDEARDERIKEVGTVTKNGDYQVSPGTKEHKELVTYLNEMGTSEIDDPEPIIDESDLETLDLSVEDIDRIEAIGLLKEDS